MTLQSYRSPITDQMTRIAFDIARHHGDRSPQIYLNLLAIQVIEKWLNALLIETDASGSLAVHSPSAFFTDHASLILPELGVLECRGILPPSAECGEGEPQDHGTITAWGTSDSDCPESTMDDCLGSVVVEVHESLGMANILGYSPLLGSVPSAIDQLLDLDLLLEKITEREEAIAAIVAGTSASAPVAAPVTAPADRPSPWISIHTLLAQAGEQTGSLKNAVQQAADQVIDRVETVLTETIEAAFNGWQLDDLANPGQLQPSFRGSATPTRDRTTNINQRPQIGEPWGSRKVTKNLEFSASLHGDQLQLSVIFLPQKDQNSELMELSVTVRSYQHQYLPAGLTLGVRDEHGQTIPDLEDVVASYGYSSLRLAHPFWVDRGDRFILHLQLGNEVIREYLHM